MPLLESVLADARERWPSPAFVIVSGDSAAHSLGKEHRLLSISRVTDLVRRSFPNTTIVWVLGNDDCYDNYKLPLPAYKWTHELWRIWEADMPNDDHTRQGFLRGAYYSVDVAVGVGPSSRRVRVMSLNTIFYSKYFAWESAMGDDAEFDDDPGGQFAWMEHKLKEAAVLGLPVIMALHIPMGFALSQISGKFTSEKEWHQHYADRFLRIVSAHNMTILALLAGHLHKDITSLYPNPPVPMYTAPSVSPVYTNNPSYRVFPFRTNMPSQIGIRDMHTYVAPLYGTVDALGTFGQSLQWQREYSFTEAYGVRDMSVSSITRYMRNISTDAHTYNAWLSHRDGGVSFPAFYQTCIFTSQDANALDKCVRGRIDIGE